MTGPLRGLRVLDIATINVVPRFAGAPCEIRHSGGGALGQDNAAFYGGDLALAPDDIEQLQAAAVI